jgi:hypothetical protein
LQRGLPLWFLGSDETTRNLNERPPAVRHRKADLHRSVKGQLEFQFTGRGLTSYAGVEVLRRFLQLCRFNRLLNSQLRPVGLPGDFRFLAMVRLVLVLVIVGGRRLGHVEFLRSDPMIERFIGLPPHADLIPEVQVDLRIERFEYRSRSFSGSFPGRGARELLESTYVPWQRDMIDLGNRVNALLGP